MGQVLGGVDVLSKGSVLVVGEGLVGGLPSAFVAPLALAEDMVGEAEVGEGWLVGQVFDDGAVVAV